MFATRPALKTAIMLLAVATWTLIASSNPIADNGLLKFLHLLDWKIFHIINGFAGQSEAVDKIVRYVNWSELFKGTPLVVIIWVLWFLPNKDIISIRHQLTATMAVAIIAIGTGRIAALTLPFRPRPMHDSAIDIVMPYGGDAQVLSGWSSFPSDHAVLFFSISACLLMINRIAGIIAVVHAAAIVTVPRIFLGLHWPSDIIGGLILGFGIAFIVMKPVTLMINRSKTANLIMSREYILYPALFLVTFQIATMFDSSRGLIKGIARLVHV